MSSVQHKKHHLFLVLSGIFITNALLAEIIGVKIFSLEDTLGLPAAQIHLLKDFILDFNLTAGVVLWPVVFITTDIINEYFGKAGVRRVSMLTVTFIVYTFLAITLITFLSPAKFWLDINKTDPAGNPLNINEAFNVIFRQGLGIMVGSVVAFLVGQIADAYTFQWMRRMTGSRNIWLRATGSTLFSQLIDSFVVLVIAFYLLSPNPWSLKQVIAVGIINYIYKFTVAIAVTPLLYGAHYLIQRYLGKQASEQMAEEASRTEMF